MGKLTGTYRLKFSFAYPSPWLRCSARFHSWPVTLNIAAQANVGFPADAAMPKLGRGGLYGLPDALLRAGCAYLGHWAMTRVRCRIVSRERDRLLAESPWNVPGLLKTVAGIE